MLRDISIIIPSYNGLELLKKSIPPLLSECSNYKGKTEIIVVDDGGIDRTPLEIPRLFPGVRVVQRKENGGFSKAVNTGILGASYPYVFLLNSDIEVTAGIFAKLAECFDDPAVFAVQAKIISTEKDIKTNYINTYYSKFGIFVYEYVTISPDITHPVEIGFASGGASLMDRDKLLSLNLFDELFSPFYAEDLDLSFRAKLWGWKTLFHPGAVTYHRHVASTISAYFSYTRKNIIHTRNIYYFYFKNLPALNIFPLCAVTLPLYLFYKLLKGNPWHLIGFTASIFSFCFKNGKPAVLSRNILYAGEAPSGSDERIMEALSKTAPDGVPGRLFAVFARDNNSGREYTIPGAPRHFNSMSLMNLIPGFIKSIYLAKSIRPESIHCSFSSLFYGLSWRLASKVLGVPFVLHAPPRSERDLNGGTSADQN